jgi:hypothetical protein
MKKHTEGETKHLFLIIIFEKKPLRHFLAVLFDLKTKEIILIFK